MELYPVPDDHRPNSSVPFIMTANGSPAAGHRKRSCVRCQQRKVKCDRSEPCLNCIKARVECISASTLSPRTRKKRFPEAELLSRLKKYERHLRAYGADIDAINSEVEGTKSSPALSSPTRIPPALEALSARKSPKSVKNKKPWTGINNELRDAEEILQGSSDDEVFKDPIRRTFDSIGSCGEELIFGLQPTESLTSLHPTPIQIFQLWQAYLDRVSPLVKIFHAPTIQQKVIEASSDLEHLPKETESLLFAIYSIAIRTMEEDECHIMFAENKEALFARFQSGLRHALLEAGFLRSSDIMFSNLRLAFDPRALYCLTGIAIRIAQRVGLNLDGTTLGLPPFDVEMRRRLWWHIIILDIRAAELSGASTSVPTHTWTTQLPLNVNESDLFPKMQDQPKSRDEPTEMLFVLVRCAVAEFALQSRDTPDSSSFPDQVIDGFEAQLESKYLKHCKSSVPLHCIAALTAKTAVCRLRIGSLHPRVFSNPGDHMTKEPDTLLTTSLKMIEYYNELMRNSSLKPFTWFLATNIHFPAHIYVLYALRQQPTGKFAEEAWLQVAEYMDYGGIRFRLLEKKSAMHLAFANLTIKAWEARENAIQQPVVPPLFISELRQKLAGSRLKPSNISSSSFRGTFDSLSFGDSFDSAQSSMANHGYSPLLPDLLSDKFSPINWSMFMESLEPMNIYSDGIF
ncbi:hypothetical protein B7494_g869 [Chlorociboria aeruginascens]|nr:hypothetical protein B7494_g869 [Chlorociboria aeruginascens]